MRLSRARVLNEDVVSIDGDPVAVFIFVRVAGLALLLLLKASGRFVRASTFDRAAVAGFM